MDARCDVRVLPNRKEKTMEKTQIKTSELGTTGLEITRVGFGAWAIGGAAYDWGWGAQDDEDSIAAIHHALELGVNWIDTAAQYGFGHSEEVVGRALAGLAERPYVFTKGGQPEGPDRTTVQSLRRDSLRRELEGSLSRLGVEAIDLYQIHWPIPDEEIEEGWSTLAELKEEGLVRHIGVSNFNVEQLRRSQSIAPVETLQPPYSLVEREVEDDDPPLRRARGDRHDRLLADGLRSADRRDDARADRGLPEDDWRKHSERFQEPQLSRHLALVERLRAVAGGSNDAGRGRGRLDAAEPSRERRHRRLQASRPGRSDHRRGEPRARRGRRRDNRRGRVKPAVTSAKSAGRGEAPCGTSPQVSRRTITGS